MAGLAAGFKYPGPAAAAAGPRAALPGAAPPPPPAAGTRRPCLAPAAAARLLPPPLLAGSPPCPAQGAGQPSFVGTQPHPLFSLDNLAGLGCSSACCSSQRPNTPIAHLQQGRRRRRVVQRQVAEVNCQAQEALLRRLRASKAGAMGCEERRAPGKRSAGGLGRPAVRHTRQHGLAVCPHLHRAREADAEVSQRVAAAVQRHAAALAVLPLQERRLHVGARLDHLPRRPACVKQGAIDGNGELRGDAAIRRQERGCAVPQAHKPCAAARTWTAGRAGRARR